MKSTLLLVIALAIGFGSGVAFQRWKQRPVNDLVESVAITHTAANATRCVSLLRLLRAGDTDSAANRLEIYLDGDLIGLGPAYQTATPEQRKAAWAAQAIQMAREYRQVHPHTPDAAIASAVSETLSITTP